MHLKISCKTRAQKKEKGNKRTQDSMHTHVSASQIARCTLLSTREPGRHGKKPRELQAKRKPMPRKAHGRGSAVSDNTKNSKKTGEKESWRMQKDYRFVLRSIGEDRTKEKSLQVPAI